MKEQPIQPAGSWEQLPQDLPVPVDDGACRHLPGLAIPSAALQSTSGRQVDLSALQSSSIVVFCYPMTGTPGQPLPEGWNGIPGARGCTPKTCGFRDHHQELKKLGAQVFGMSTQDTRDQQEMVERLHVPFEVLSDSSLVFTKTLNLPTFKIKQQTYIKRLTLILRRGKIAHVFYPIFPPDAHAAHVVDWLSANPANS